MKVRVDGDLCAGHGRCYELAPEVFGEDERGHCRVLCADVPAALSAKARLGERNCPEGAIFIDEE
jgi:ferredoxin